MVPPRNVDLLVAALSRVIGDEEFRAALGAAARERVTREYAMEGIFPRYVGVWRSICGRSADEPEAQIAG
jgi:glycosyltransferase involved in cell wall biosynthesis